MTSRPTISRLLGLAAGVTVSAALAAGSAGSATAATARQDHSVFFHSPSGNISCEIDTRAGVSTGFCQTAHKPESAQLRQDRVQVCVGVRCLGNAPSSSSVLQYGRSAGLGAVTCTSRRTGMTCLEHGHGFQISRSGIRRV